MIASFIVLQRYTVQSTARELLYLEVLLTLCLFVFAVFILQWHSEIQLWP